MSVHVRPLLEEGEEGLERGAGAARRALGGEAEEEQAMFVTNVF